MVKQHSTFSCKAPYATRYITVLHHHACSNAAAATYVALYSALT